MIEKSIILLVIIQISYLYAADSENRQFSLFNVVKFPNIACVSSTGTSRNGTCFTAEECKERGGTGTGSCANGYGVCCIVELSCGGTTSVNCSYLYQASTTSPSRTCKYSVCTAGKNICRIRYDLNTFDINTPVQGTAATTSPPTTNGGAIGDCVNDRFVITSPGVIGSPVICGYNSGQHIFVDAPNPGSCQTAAFLFGGDSYTRKYDIKVSQFDCGSEAGGPPGCLQYFTATSGKIASFGYDTSKTTVSSTATHLSNQLYEICFRRGSGNCALCFWPSVTGSFGISTTSTKTGVPTGAAQSDAGLTCSEDYIVIPFGVASTTTTYASATTLTGLINPSTSSVTRNCGRFLGTTNTATTASTVCTNVRPFSVTVRFNQDEATSGTDKTTTNEQYKTPGGIIGFWLKFKQVTCT